MVGVWVELRGSGLFHLGLCAVYTHADKEWFDNLAHGLAFELSLGDVVHVNSGSAQFILVRARIRVFVCIYLVQARSKVFVSSLSSCGQGIILTIGHVFILFLSSFRAVVRFRLGLLCRCMSVSGLSCTVCTRVG